MQVRVEPLTDGVIQPSTSFDYEWRFSDTTDCYGELLNVTETITTDSYGRGFVEIDLSTISRNPNYVCEYKDEVLRATLEVPDVLATRLFAETLYVENTADINGDVDIDGEVTINGNLLANIPYGEMWNYSSNATSWEFEIASSGIYYNLTGLIAGELNDFTFTSSTQANGGSYLTCGNDGIYLINFEMSAETTNPNQLYGVGVVHDYDIDTHRNCYARRTLERDDVASVHITCLMDLNVGDAVNIQVENEASNSNLEIHTANLNIIRVGGLGS